MTQPSVGIVTRTKNRRVLLKRALESVLFQSYANWTMVIVNDAGDRDDVEALVGSYAAEAAGRVRVIHNARSLGMEGASKVGLDALATDLLIVHDDDDSWAPEFLTVAVRELQRMQESYPGVQGVTTYANLVMEHVHGNVVQTDSIEPFNDWVPPGFLSLDRMLASNFIPPISFLFSRAAFDELGGVYEVVPYLGDWDFLIRFLSRYEVVMVPQFLAFYHWRSRAQSGVLGNSVTGEVDRHHFVRQLLLNRWLRADLAAGRFGIGAYANLRRHIETLVEESEKRVGTPPPPHVAPPRYSPPAAPSAPIDAASPADQPVAALEHEPAAAVEHEPAAAPGGEQAPADMPHGWTETPPTYEPDGAAPDADGVIPATGIDVNGVAAPPADGARPARVARVLRRLRAWTTKR